jgi:hypothetical protein
MTQEVDEDKVPAVVESEAFDIARTDPSLAFSKMREVVRLAADRCVGPAFVVNIQGKKYPKVEWWTTVGFSLGLVPREVSSTKLDRENELAYESAVEVWRGNQLVTRATAICSSTEKRWHHADEYAVKSMATTRATGKAYRIPLSFLAVMSGLEPTPADEVPPGGFETAPVPRVAQWESGSEPELPPLEPEVVAPVTDVSDVKKALFEELLAWPIERRDAVMQACSMVRDENGKPKVKNDRPVCIESVEKALSPKISDKWAAATLGKVKAMKQRLAQGAE